MIYLTNTFSPAMVAGENTFVGKKVSLNSLRETLQNETVTSAVSHEVTAKILSALLEKPVKFARVNLALQPGDRVLCVIPNFRAQEAREFTFEEVSEAGFSAFEISIN